MKAFRRGIGLSLEESRDRRIPHDPKWTREAFVNILDNAVKYSPEGTSVTVRMSYLASAVMIEFEDQGIGVPQEEAHRIFQRFYRGSARQVQEGEGGRRGALPGPPDPGGPGRHYLCEKGPPGRQQFYRDPSLQFCYEFCKRSVSRAYYTGTRVEKGG